MKKHGCDLKNGLSKPFIRSIPVEQESSSYVEHSHGSTGFQPFDFFTLFRSLSSRLEEFHAGFDSIWVHYFQVL